MTTDVGPDPALVASQSSQSTLSRPEASIRGKGFTPGPWLADPMVPNAKGAFYIVGNLDGNNATVDVATVGPSMSPRAEANARLIAAAPELYEALETAAKRFRGYEQIHRLKGTPEGYLKADNNGDLAIYCEAALAKARGDSSAQQDQPHVR